MRFMKISSSARYTLGIFAAISMLAGCSSGGSQIAPTGSIRLNAGAFGVNAGASVHRFVRRLKFSCVDLPSGLCCVTLSGARNSTEPSD